MHPRKCGGNARSDDRGARQPRKLVSVGWCVGRHPRRWLGVCWRLQSVGSKNVGQFADGEELIISECGKGRSRRRVFECSMDEIEYSLSGGIGRRGFGHGTVMWKQIDSLGDALGSSCGDVDAVAPIMLRGSANVPAVDSMWIPGALVGRSFVDKYFDARRRKRGAIVAENTIELSVCQEPGVDA
jgi:hypothetical protein